jgi:hypothetical protein
MAMHVRQRLWLALLLGAAAIGSGAVVWAQSGGGYDASFTAFDGGGETVSGGSYVLQTGVGQPIAGRASGTGYSMDVGVLAGGVGAAGSVPTPGPPGAYKLNVPQLAKD